MTRAVLAVATGGFWFLSFAVLRDSAFVWPWAGLGALAVCGWTHRKFGGW